MSAGDAGRIRAIVFCLAMGIFMAAAVAGNRPYPEVVRAIFWAVMMAALVAAFTLSMSLGRKP